MILIDLSRTLIAGIIKQSEGKKIDEPMCRHTVLSMIQYINKQYRREYGQMVLAVDDRKYWRKEIYQYYKAHRAASRAESPLDWEKLFAVADNIKRELQENFPYTFVQIPRAEADDVIGTICHHYGVDFGPADEKILIVAADGDFNQLLQYGNVTQYDAHNKRFSVYQPNGLFEKIVKGDKKDGIPNILTDDDFFVNPDKKRQASITKKVLADAQENKEKYARNWSRNEQLIDLSKIPDDIKTSIITKVEEGPKVKDRSLLPAYFAKHKLRVLYDNIQNF